MIRFLASLWLVVSLAAPQLKAQFHCSNLTKLTVVETHDFSPVFPAVVYFEGFDKSFETSADGYVLLDSICDGTYTVIIRGAGYEEKKVTITVKKTTPIKVKVNYELHALKEVTVAEDQKNSLIQSGEKLNRGAITANQGKSLATLLEGVNGVSMLSNGASIAKPVIHGLHSNRILILNNGVRQEDQQWGAEHAPNIDPSAAETITVVKGAAGVRYGTDAIGGMILVEPKAMPTKPGWSGEAAVSAHSNNRMGVGSAMLQHTLKNIPALSFRLQGSYKKGGNYRVPGYWVSNTGVQETNYSGTAAYRKLHYGAELYYSRFATTLGLYTGSHTGNQKDLMNAINSPIPLVQSGFTYEVQRPRQNVTHHLAKMKLYADSRLGTWNVIYGYQHNFRQEYDIIRQENGKAQLNLTLQTHTLNINLDHKKIFGLTGQAGVDILSQDNRFRDGDRIFIPTFKSAGSAGYLIERYRFNKTTVEAGLRYDVKWYGVYNPQGSNQQIVYYEFNYRNASGTLGIKQDVSSTWNWSATVANAWRAPQANELFSAGLHQGAARVELGNKELRPENAYGINLDNNYRLGNRLHTSVSLYSQLINNYIYLEPGEDLLTIRGYFKTFNYRQTNAWLNGADVSLRYEWSDYLSSTVKGSFLRARNRTSKDWLILMPSDRLSSATRFNKNLSEEWRNVFAEVSGRYVFRQSRLPRNFDQIDYPRPPKGYFILDAAVGTQYVIAKQPVDMSLSVNNVLNVRYRDYMDVFRYFLDQPGTNVVLRLSIPFQF